MIKGKESVFNTSVKQTYSLLTDVKKLEDNLFTRVAKKLQEIGASLTIDITYKKPNKIIYGKLGVSQEFQNILPTMFFNLSFEPISNSSTRVFLKTSYDKNDLTEQYLDHLEKSTRNKTRIAVITVIALVAIIIPAGIIPLLYDSITENSENIVQPLLSDNELTLATAELYLDLSETETAYRLYEKARLENPDSVESLVGSRLSLTETENYDQLLSKVNSLLVVDQRYSNPPNSNDVILQASFYPEGLDGPGILIPRTNDGKISLNISLDAITENLVPAIVYPVDSQFPTVVYPKSLDTPHKIVSPESIDSVDLQNHIIITPGKLTHPDAKFMPYNHKSSLEYTTGKDGPLIVYPYGISSTEDLPALIFPDEEFYPLRITLKFASGDVVLPDDYTSDQLAKINPNILQAYDNKSVRYIDIVFENGIPNTDILSQINPNIPVRIFPNGPDSIPIVYPEGLDFSRSSNVPSSEMTNSDSDEVISKT